MEAEIAATKLTSVCTPYVHEAAPGAGELREQFTAEPGRMLSKHRLRTCLLISMAGICRAFACAPAGCLGSGQGLQPHRTCLPLSIACDRDADNVGALYLLVIVCIDWTIGSKLQAGTIRSTSSSTDDGDEITARSITFSSSRILPGQE